MKRKIYAYPKCSTCIKAQKYLNGRNLGYEILDITQVPPSKAEIKKMLSRYNGAIKKLFNTSGVMYREMGLSTKIDKMSEGELIDLLAANGKLIKRPFLLVDGKAICVGFKEQEWQEALP